MLRRTSQCLGLPSSEQISGVSLRSLRSLAAIKRVDDFVALVAFCEKQPSPEPTFSSQKQTKEAKDVRRVPDRFILARHPVASNQRTGIAVSICSSFHAAFAVTLSGFPIQRGRLRRALTADLRPERGL